MFFLSLFVLFIALISLWIKKNPLIWGSFCLISLILATSSHQMQFQALIPLSILAILCWSLLYNIQGLTRFLFVSTTILLCGALFAIPLPGFPSLLFFFTAPINYGKIFAGILLLTGPVSICASRWIQSCKTSIPIAIIGTSLLFGCTLFLNLGHFQSSFCLSQLAWSFFYLLGSIIPEEALLRGFIQKELFQWMGKTTAAHVLSILVSSFLFSLFYTIWVTDLFLLLFTFISGLVYGTIYQITRQVESCILCRWLTVSLHATLLAGGFNL